MQKDTEWVIKGISDHEAELFRDILKAYFPHASAVLRELSADTNQKEPVSTLTAEQIINAAQLFCVRKQMYSRSVHLLRSYLEANKQLFFDGGYLKQFVTQALKDNETGTEKDFGEDIQEYVDSFFAGSFYDPRNFGDTTFLVFKEAVKELLKQ